MAQKAGRSWVKSLGVTTVLLPLSVGASTGLPFTRKRTCATPAVVKVVKASWA